MAFQVLSPNECFKWICDNDYKGGGYHIALCDIPKGSEVVTETGIANALYPRDIRLTSEVIFKGTIVGEYFYGTSLKNRYGSDYLMEIRIPPPKPSIPDIY